ncbi:cytochrome-c peroxidase [Candidatus Palauibacter sp.]|uniref:cytochrome-c peroxidase n=1 Tax=Candidatus Palauibacter sp. TaxID=3101350 RepID=UPI003AF24789
MSHLQRDKRSPRRANANSPLRSPAALLLALAPMQACTDDVVDPLDPVGPDDPVQTGLVATVRELAREQDLRPVTLPAPVRGELVTLGRALAFDKILSGNRDVSCMTCHLPTFATGDGKSLPVGQGGEGLGPDRTHPDGQFTLRHSLALFNLHRVRKFFWDGRLEELDDGSIGSPAGEHLTSEMEAVLEFGAVSAAGLFPVSSREEMLGPGNELAEVPDGNFTELWSRIMARLGTIDEYRELFESAYPGTSFDDMTFAHASNAIGGFFASSFSFSDSPWDRFLGGDDDQLAEAQLRGARNFMTVGCTKCHQTDVLDARPGNEFHNDALAQFGPGQGDGPTGTDDFGRERATGDPEDRRRFKTPPLRNVELTAPYGHVGQFVTLRGFVEHYNNVDSTLVAYDVSQVEALLRPTLLHNYDEILATRDTMLLPIRLEEAEVDDLIEFLKALTDDAARDLSAVTPASVPSGLPIDRSR